MKLQILQSLRHPDRPEDLVLKLKGFLDVGFWNLNDNILRHEGDLGGGETWRLAHKNSSLFRVVGFVETDAKKDFIALDAFYKANPNSYSPAQIKRMKEISEVKRKGPLGWEKRKPS